MVQILLLEMTVLSMLASPKAFLEGPEDLWIDRKCD
jgi:hypothetical protein